eukprot:9115587-Karenia_brevis.AAC.1
MVGKGGNQVSEARVLNRILRVTEKGWEYEPDQRHAELIVEELGLTGANPVDTPGEKMKPHEKERSQEKVDKDKATRYRQTAARANYLAQDRPDIMFAVKEIGRGMN